MSGYDRSKDPRAHAPEPRPAGLTQHTADQPGTSLQAASTPMTGKGVHTSAPNVLPAPPVTAGHTMGSKPGAKNPASPGMRSTGVGAR